MNKYHATKNRKHAIRKMCNRIRRLCDSWFSKPWIVAQRRDARNNIKEQE